MSKIRKIEITIETHEVTRTRRRDPRSSEPKAIDVNPTPIDSVSELMHLPGPGARELPQPPNASGSAP